jgi:hypothetical protein
VPIIEIGSNLETTIAIERAVATGKAIRLPPEI